MVGTIIDWSFHYNAILFSWWTAHTFLTFSMSLIIIFMLSVATEWSKRRLPLLLLDREYLGKRSLTLLTLFQSLLSTILMLVLMTFNGYIILAIVLGTSAGRYRYYEDIENDCEMMS